jgi:hypothetical protein
MPGRTSNRREWRAPQNEREFSPRWIDLGTALATAAWSNETQQEQIDLGWRGGSYETDFLERI